jgi:hypothetical protein
MAKNSITDYDNTSGNNTDVQSVDISEGCSPSGINNAIREVMADLADVNDGTVALTSPQAANMTVTGTVTTDTIAENTSAAGVTIDGVLLKDGGVDINGNELILDADGDTSITADTDDQIDFKTGGSDRMVIDSSDISFSSNIKTNGNSIYAGATSQTVDISSGTAFNTGGAAMALRGSATGYNDHGIEFYSGGSERMRLDSSGRLKINTVATAGVLCINNFEGAAHCLDLGTDVGSDILANFRLSTNADGSGGTVVGSISVSGSSTGYNTSSDYRLKENVTDITGATDRLKQLNPVRFNFIADADTTVDGFLAHEVQDVVPEAITGTHNEVDDDGNPVYQGIDQSKLVPLLVATIQELEARIAALETA